MTFKPGRLTALLVGADRGRTRRAVALAVGFAVAGAALEYLLFRTGFENAAVEILHEALLLDGYLPGPGATGALFVVGLAALQAYLNEGYLPSVLLGWSLVYGNVSWTLGSPTGFENYSLDPVAAFGRTFPEAIVLATLGFAVGVGARRIRRRGRSEPPTRSTSDPGRRRDGSRSDR